MSNSIVPLSSDIKHDFNVFIEELIVLESKYSEKLEQNSLINKNTANNPLIKQYEQLLGRVKNYAQNKEEIEEKESVILNYIAASILSRKNHILSLESSELVIDILGFIKSIRKYIEEFKEQQKIEKIEWYKKQFNFDIEQKIKSSQSFREKLKQAIEDYNQQLDKKLEDLKKEIRKFIEEGEDNEKKLRNNKDKLQNFIMQQKFFSVVKTLSSCIGVATSPVGPIVSDLVNTGLDMGQGFCQPEYEKVDSEMSEDMKKFIEYDAIKDIPSKKSTGKAIKKYGKPVLDMSHEIVDAMEKYLKEKKDDANKSIEKAKEMKKRLNSICEEIIPELKEIEDPASEEFRILIENELERLTDNIDRYQAFGDLLFPEEDIQEIVRRFDVQRNKLENRIRNNGQFQQKKENITKIKRNIKIAKVTGTLLDGFSEFMTIDSNGDQMVDQIEKTIRENKTTIENLKKFKKKVKEFENHQVNQLKDSVKNLYKRLENKSYIEQSFTNWKMQKNLKEIKHELNKMTSTFKVNKDLMFIFEQINDAIETLVDMYDRIENYHEKQKMVDYIANVNAAGVNADYDELRQLKQIILNNIIRERYITLISACKQWAFPFAKNFTTFNRFPLNDSHDINNEISPINIDLVIKDINDLENKIQEYNAKITTMDSHIIKDYFGGDSKKDPLFIWDYNSYGKTIDKLLKESESRLSEEVVLKADVKKSKEPAIKMNQIEIKFKHVDESKQQELDSCLDNFVIYLTHSTVSRYKIGNHYYKFGGTDNNFNSDNKSNESGFVFMYRFQKKEDKTPYGQNKAYEKLGKGELMLSPYTNWKIQLGLVNENARNYFDDLQEYSGNVYLELIGSGSYIDIKHEKDYLKNLSLDKYYDIDTTIPQLSFE